MKHVDFVHLHLHTQYSLLDGTIRLADLFKKARDYKMPAVAITDHGNMYGAVDFYQQAYKAGIKPIIGCELYVAPKSRFDKASEGPGETARHLIVLAKNLQGYRNLIKLTSSGFLEGFYYRPRVDKELLAKHSEGLIATSACLHGEVADGILKGDLERAKASARQYREIFGEGNYYLEMMENGIPEQSLVNEKLMEISKELSIPLVATNDCHYLDRTDSEAHEVLLCIQTGKNMDETGRMRFATDAFYLKSPDEMKQLFAYCPEAIENTVAIAEKCNLKLDFNQIFLPHFDIGQGRSLDEHLQGMAKAGLEKLMPKILQGKDPSLRQKYDQRLVRELDIIKSMGFAGYFLIVSDFINYAKSREIPVGPGRGSAAGSLAAYAIGITEIDPIRYGLFFERFLNPDRKSMPDIDTDFCMEGRDEVIRYVSEKYGTDRVAQIITFGKMQAKAVIRDVGRALNMPYGEVDRIAKLVPNVLNITLEDAIKQEPLLREEQKKNDKVRRLLVLSRSLEGLNRHSSTHAAGVVISDKPLVERVPLCKSPNGDIVTQFSMNDLSAAGLTKFDFLGLKTLTVIRDALKFIEEGKGVRMDISDIPLDDRKTFQLLSKGETDGVFQLESRGMKEILVGMKPDCFEDIIALIALYRPGPLKSGMVQEFISRKQGKTKSTYEVPSLEPILKETYGVILYQEQVMQIASALASYTMGEADTFRKAMSKKNSSEMEKEKPKFLAGAHKNKIPEAKARKIFDQMETFAGYGFNKSHSAAYAMISYQTAYLKTHYPVEFMAALLTSEKGNRDKVIKHISVCKDMGINVLPPDINQSVLDFGVDGGNIRFGLAAVKNVGESAIESIIESRDNEGSFKSFLDFCSRVDLRKINKRVVESLIKCGAFDSLGYGRRQLMENFERVMDIGQKAQDQKLSDQVSLFDGPDSCSVGPEYTEKDLLPETEEWEHGQVLKYEKETIGFYITGHPLLRYADKLKLITDADSERISEMRDKDTVTVAGIVSHKREIATKRKDTMAYVTIEDLKGSYTGIVFSDTYRDYRDLIDSDEPLLFKGTLDVTEESARLVVSEIHRLTEYNGVSFSSIHVVFDANRMDESHLGLLREICRKYPGKHDCYLHLILQNQSETVVYLGNESKINISQPLKEEVEHLLGPGSTTLH